MSNKSPHVILITALFGFAHQLHLGAESIERLLPHGVFPSLTWASNLLVALSVWLLVIRLIPLACRAILRGYEAADVAAERCSAWTKRNLVKLIRLLLARLSQDNPQP